MRALDRYVLKEWLRIFLITTFGFPVMIVIVDLTEKLDTYLQRQIPARDIAVSYLYGVPETMFQVLPAAVLFATVFTVSSFTRYSEITAAKASGISFHRFIRPLTLGAVFAMCIGFSLNVIIPPLNQKKLNLLQEQKFKDTGERYNFAFATGEGRTYKVGALHASRNMIENLEVERLGRGPAMPTMYALAEQAFYRKNSHWMMVRGNLHIVPNATVDIVFTYDSLLDRSFTERPLELNAATKAPADMGWQELGRYIRALQRSGSDVNPLKVERMLKLAIPVTCVIILLFAAPLATSTQRGGAAWGIGVSLLTTVIFLVLVNLMRGFGGKGIISPDLAAWVPSLIFGVVGAVLLWRVRT
ncbi:MAG: LptF/LptG family permease [Gemmatimonadaceae bacterium]|nr:LptF/LptG family permease [Gemmatimonadaceae bacterium]